REEERHEHRDGEGRLDRRQASLIVRGPRQRTACIWLTRAWRRATRPLFHAVTPTTSVPSTTAAPMMYSIVASPSLAEQKRRSTDIEPPSWIRRGWLRCSVLAMVRSAGTAVPAARSAAGECLLGRARVLHAEAERRALPRRA